MKNARIVVLSTALLLSVSVAGCKSSAQSSGSAANPTNPVATKPAPTTSAPGGGSGNQIDVCTALPLATVVSATGRAYKKTQTKTISSPTDGSICTYSGASDDDLLDLSITVLYGDTDAMYKLEQSNSTAAGETMTPLSGFGDRAFIDEDDLAVVFGDTLIEVTDLVTPPGVKPMTTEVKKSLVQSVRGAL